MTGVRFYIYISFLIVAGSITIFSCTKKKDVQVPQQAQGHCSPATYYIGADMANSRYKPGTYWVYTDSITGIGDSITVDSYSQGMNPVPCITFEYHRYYITGYPSAKKDSFVVMIDGVHKGLNPYSKKVYMDPTGSSNFDSTYSTNYVVKYYDSLFVYDRYYKKVEKTVVNPDTTESNNKVFYYINVDYGFLKKEIYNSSGTIISRKILIKKNMVR